MTWVFQQTRDPVLHAARPHPNRKVISSMIRLFWILVVFVGIPPFFAFGQTHEPQSVGQFGQEVRTFHTLETGLPSNDVRNLVLHGEKVFAETSVGWITLKGGNWTAVDGLQANPSQTADPNPLRQALSVTDSRWLQSPACRERREPSEASTRRRAAGCRRARAPHASPRGRSTRRAR